MKGSKRLKGVIAGGAAVFIAAVCAAGSAFAGAFAPAKAAFANSGPTDEYGVMGAGVYVRNEKSVLAVESEKLTFDIQDFPQLGYGEELADNDYKSTVTAEYKFVNTSGNTVRTSMAFPLGNVPSYYEYTYPVPAPGSSGPSAFNPTITVNGDEVPMQLRHTYGHYGYYDGFAAAAAELKDEWYEDDFYKPDTPVTAYSVKVDRGNYSNIDAIGTVSGDRSKVRYFSPNGYYDEMNYYYYETGSSFEDLVDSGQYVFYVLGDKSELNIDWKVRREKYRFGIFGGKIIRSDVDLPVEVQEITDKDGQPVYPTLKDLVLSKRPLNCAVSDMDYYNAIAQNEFSNDKEYLFGGDFRNFSASYGQFCVWYTYGVEVAPKGSIINTVKSPVYPTVELGYDPYVYSYEYFLSPAAEWADFGKLQIEINTPYCAVNMRTDFTKGVNGYSATFDGLPSGNLSFKLSTSENPEYVGRSPGTAISWSVIIIVLVLFFLAAAKIIVIAVAVPIVLVVKSKAK